MRQQQLQQQRHVYLILGGGRVHCPLYLVRFQPPKATSLCKCNQRGRLPASALHEIPLSPSILVSFLFCVYFFPIAFDEQVFSELVQTSRAKLTRQNRNKIKENSTQTVHFFIYHTYHSICVYVCVCNFQKLHKYAEGRELWCPFKANQRAEESQKRELRMISYICVCPDNKHYE